MPQPQPTNAEIEAIDLALAVYHDGTDWRMTELREGVLENVETIDAELARFPGEAGALALLAVDEDFVVLVRHRDQGVQVVLSDLAVVPDWTLARSVVDELGIRVGGDQAGPCGDLDMLADLGIPAEELEELLADDELFPDEVVEELSIWLGLAEVFDDLVGSDE